MRRLLKLTLMTAVLATLLVSPTLAKKAPIERTVVDGVTLAQVKPHTQLAPYYPATARTSNPYAEVLMAVEVDEKGKVAGTEVISASVEGMGFGKAAQDAVEQWRFHPALKDGEAISSTSVIRLTFAPPTLRTPDGMVYTDTATRFFEARHFDPHAPQGRDWDAVTASVAGLFNSPANHDPRKTIQKADLPPCAPDRNYHECMYDRRDMVQFGGGAPHDTPLPEVK